MSAIACQPDKDPSRDTPVLRRGLVREWFYLLAGVLLLVALAAAALRLCGATSPRRLNLLELSGHPPASIHTWLSILQANLLVAGFALPLICICQGWWRIFNGPVPVGVRVFYLLVIGYVSVTTIQLQLVVEGLAVYGVHLLVSIASYGPIELAAYALAWTLYLRSAASPLTVVQITRVAGGVVLLLLVAATLETWAHS